MIEIFVVSYNSQSRPIELKGTFGPDGGTLGRNPDNTLVLPDPARHVSRLHARVRFEGGQFVIANISGANPLFVNDEEVETGAERPLAPGAELRIGNYVLGVRQAKVPAAGVRATVAAAGVSLVAASGEASPQVPARDVAGSRPMMEGSVDPLAGLGGGAAGPNPFADILGAAVPAPNAEAGAFESPEAAIPEPAIAPANGLPRGAAPSSAHDAPREQYAFPANPSNSDPFADLLQPDASSSASGPPPPNSGDRIAVTPLSSDPFADLLQSSPSSAPGAGFGAVLGRSGAPPGAPASAGLPDDFDPFALPSSAPRNTDDPLRELAGSSIDLNAVAPDVAPDALLGFPLADKPDPRDPLRGGTPSMVDSLDVVDPLKLFGSAEDGLLGRNGDSFASGPPMPDKVPEIDAHFVAPRGVPERADIAQAENRRAEAPPLRTAVPLPPASSARPRVAPALSSAEIAPASSPGVIPAEASAPKPAPASRAQMDAHPRAGPGADSAAATAAPQPVAAPAAPMTAPPAAEIDLLLASFLKGARVPGIAVPGGLTPALMEMLGTLVYHATAGAMELVAARQITKREMRAEMTIIVPKGNNPLKFLPTPEAAIMQMLGPRVPGFMSTARAMQEVFDDLRAHEVGVIAGMRAALAEVLQRFDPAALEKRLGHGGLLDSLVPASRHAKLWILFAARFQEIYNEAQDDYQALFGDAFTKAYEEQVEQDRARREQH